MQISLCNILVENLHWYFALQEKGHKKQHKGWPRLLWPMDIQTHSSKAWISKKGWGKLHSHVVTNRCSLTSFMAVSELHYLQSKEKNKKLDYIKLAQFSLLSWLSQWWTFPKGSQSDWRSLSQWWSSSSMHHKHPCPWN